MTEHPAPTQFDVSGSPKGQPRPRAFSRGGHASVYDPGTAEGWKGQIALAAKPHIPSPPWEGPIGLWLDFRIARPASHFRKRKGVAVLREDAAEWVTAKPDADNYAKAVMDCLTQIGWWRDDSQVSVLRATKRYVVDDEVPGCRIKVGRMA